MIEKETILEGTRFFSLVLLKVILTMISTTGKDKEINQGTELVFLSRKSKELRPFFIPELSRVYSLQLFDELWKVGDCL